MENHPYPFICTTNLKERLDQASWRRFTLKLRFEAMLPVQAAVAFRRFFGIEPPDVLLPDGLTPGDFACVKRKQKLYGSTMPECLLQWLNDELAARGMKGAAFGFLPPR